MNERGKTECALLRLLITGCESGRPSGVSGLAAAIEQLDGYRWSDEEYRVVYECLRRASHVRGTRLREEMAAEATRRGHPDVDWDVYFRTVDAKVTFAQLLAALKLRP